MWRAKEHRTNLKQTGTGRGRALANIAHSLQTPLAILKSELFFLKQEHPHNGRAILCDRLIDTVSQSVNAFLHISTLEHALHEEAPATVYLSSLLKETVRHIQPLAEIHSITLVPCIEKDVRVTGARDKLYELILNILSNSVKYMGFGSTRTITVTLTKSARHARISIADTGIGIPKADIDRLYTSLFRGENGRARHGVSGTGLGLAISKKIVDAHKGTIQTKSAVGKGTETVIRLPLSANAAHP